MEVCVDNFHSAVNSSQGGACRLELCSALTEGGLTPSLGMYLVIKKTVHIPIFIMIRPRKGSDFLYSEEEIEVMKQDIKLFKEHGADGFVFGCLTEELTVHEAACTQLLDAASPSPCTFHRAFDRVEDPYEALEIIITLGFTRVLTSGLARTAIEGLNLIKELIEKADGRIIILPGGGINEFNLNEILIQTKVLEFHGSAKKSAYFIQSQRSSQTTGSTDSLNIVTDKDNVLRLTHIYSQINND